MPDLTQVGKQTLLNLGNINAAHQQYTGPASYTTTGDPFVAADVKLARITGMWFEMAIDNAGAVRHLIYDVVNGRVLWYDNADPHAEIAAATDLSGFSARFLAIEG